MPVSAVEYVTDFVFGLVYLLWLIALHWLSKRRRPQLQGVNLTRLVLVESALALAVATAVPGYRFVNKELLPAHYMSAGIAIALLGTIIALIWQFQITVFARTHLAGATPQQADPFATRYNWWSFAAATLVLWLGLGTIGGITLVLAYGKNITDYRNRY